MSLRPQRKGSALVTDASLDAAVDRLCMAKNTARKHLHNVSRKTGTTRQDELVALRV